MTPVTLINAFEVPAAADEEFVAAWSQARDLLAGQHGYGGAALHRSLAPSARFRFVNVGSWESPAAFQTAITTAGVSAREFPFPAHPGLYQIVSAHERVTPENNGVTLINLFEVPVDADDEFIAGWETARDHLGRRPGYISSRLHRSISPDTDYRFVNIARWRSAAAFEAAVSDPDFLSAARIPYPAHPALYQPVA